MFRCRARSPGDDVGAHGSEVHMGVNSTHRCRVSSKIPLSNSQVGSQSVEARLQVTRPIYGMPHTWIFGLDGCMPGLFFPALPQGVENFFPFPLKPLQHNASFFSLFFLLFFFLFYCLVLVSAFFVFEPPPPLFPCTPKPM